MRSFLVCLPFTFLGSFLDHNHIIESHAYWALYGYVAGLIVAFDNLLSSKGNR